MTATECSLYDYVFVLGSSMGRSLGLDPEFLVESTGDGSDTQRRCLGIVSRMKMMITGVIDRYLVRCNESLSHIILGNGVRR